MKERHHLQQQRIDHHHPAATIQTSTLKNNSNNDGRSEFKSTAKACWVISLAVICLNALVYPSTLHFNSFVWTIGTLVKLQSDYGASAGSRYYTTTDSNNAAAAIRTSSAFPFRLSCPDEEELPSGQYRLVLVYHVNMVNNWREIVRDQMQTLSSCGGGQLLGGSSRASSSFVVSYTGGNGAELRGILEEYTSSIGDGVSAQLVRSAGRQSEAGARAAFDLCSDAKKASGETKTVVFHFQNGGASDYRSDWRRHRERKDEGPYSRSLYWRKYVEHFTLERPGRCVEAITRNGASTCGVTLKKQKDGTHRYAENFWSASCDYIAALPVPNALGGSRPIGDDDGASWIGSNMPQNKSRDTKKAHVELHRTAKDRSKRLIHPEEYDKAASRFHLACPRFDRPPGNYRLVIAYHIGFLNNWREVVRDQLQTIATCGLGRAASSFLLSHSNATHHDLEEVMELVEGYEISAVPQLIEAIEMPYEGPAMNAIHGLCRRATVKTIVFYFHNKGVSRYTPDWRDKDMDRPASEWKKSPYAFLLYWRKYMEWFTIERPAVCIDAILNDGAWTCGVNMRAYHYSGNIWTADCDYLSTLAPLTGKRGYLAAEFWIGGGMNTTTLKMNKFRNLHESPPAGKAGYRHLMLPEEYVDEVYLD